MVPPPGAIVVDQTAREIALRKMNAATGRSSPGLSTKTIQARRHERSKQRPAWKKELQVDPT